MSLKIKGTLLGLGAVLAGIAIWVAFYVGLEMLAGIAGIVMVIGFIGIYRRINKEDRSNYVYIVASVASLIGIVLAELLSIVILVAMGGGDLKSFLADREVQVGMLLDLGIGLLLGVGGIIYFIVTDKKRAKVQTQKMEYKPLPPQNENSESAAEDKKEQ